MRTICRFFDSYAGYPGIECRMVFKAWGHLFAGPWHVLSGWPW